jgi:hypothetical protein
VFTGYSYVCMWSFYSSQSTFKVPNLDSIFAKTIRDLSIDNPALNGNHFPFAFPLLFNVRLRYGVKCSQDEDQFQLLSPTRAFCPWPFHLRLSPPSTLIHYDFTFSPFVRSYSTSESFKSIKCCTLLPSRNTFYI